jgi:hypothetical protein
MLERKLYIRGDHKLLYVKESMFGALDTKVRHFYTGFIDGTWYRLTDPRAGSQDIVTCFEQLEKKEQPEYPESVAWLEKYHLPKAEVSNV